MTPAIRVVLADDHALFRAGLRALLASVAGVDVVGETGDGREALRIIRKERPDVAIVDISMPGLQGLELAAALREELPRVRVIILSMHSSEEYVRRAMTNGAAGYLLKDALQEELALAVQSVARGGSYLSPAVSRAVIEGYVREGESTPAGGPHLTPRQKEILQLIAEGHSSREIGGMLHLSAKTIESHRTQLMQKLGIHDVAGLVRYAVRVGLVSTEH